MSQTGITQLDDNLAPPLGEVLYITVGDTRPSIDQVLTDEDAHGNDTPVDLTDALSITFQMRNVFGDVVVSGFAATSGPPTDGAVSYQWLPGDVQVPNGRDFEIYKVSWVVVFSDGRQSTYPNAADDRTTIHVSRPTA